GALRGPLPTVKCREITVPDRPPTVRILLRRTKLAGARWHPASTRQRAAALERVEELGADAAEQGPRRKRTRSRLARLVALADERTRAPVPQAFARRPLRPLSGPILTRFCRRNSGENLRYLNFIALSGTCDVAMNASGNALIGPGQLRHEADN